MNKDELKVALGMAKKIKASPAATLLAIVGFVLADEKLSGNELAEICNINRSTMTRNAQGYMQIAQALCKMHTIPVQNAQPPVQNAQEGFPPHPLSKNISSLRSDIYTSPAGTHTREAGADADALREKIRKGFSDFMRIYPRQIRGGVGAKAQTAYKKLIESGRTPEEIEDLVWAHAHTEEWTKADGRFVPNADKFLNRILNPEEEQAEKATPNASEGSGYIQVPLGGHGASVAVNEGSTEYKFLKAYGRWYKDLYSFNAAWANAKRDIDPELLVYCAEVARDKARERDGDTQYIRLPEEWLRDGRYEDYRKEAEYKKRSSGPGILTKDDMKAMLGLI